MAAERAKAGQAIEALAPLADRLDALAAARARPWWRRLRGNLSSSMARRIAAVTAACSSSVRSIVGMVLAASQPLSSKTFGPALHGGLIAVRHVHHPDHY
jgi:hypothetical protein